MNKTVWKEFSSDWYMGINGASEAKYWMLNKCSETGIPHLKYMPHIYGL